LYSESFPTCFLAVIWTLYWILLALGGLLDLSFSCIESSFFKKFSSSYSSSLFYVSITLRWFSNPLISSNICKFSSSFNLLFLLIDSSYSSIYLVSISKSLTFFLKSLNPVLILLFVSLSKSFCCYKSMFSFLYPEI